MHVAAMVQPAISRLFPSFRTTETICRKENQSEKPSDEKANTLNFANVLRQVRVLRVGSNIFKLKFGAGQKGLWMYEFHLLIFQSTVI